MAWDPLQQGQLLLEKLKGLDRKTLIWGAVPGLLILALFFGAALRAAQIQRLKSEARRLDQQILAAKEAQRNFTPPSAEEEEERRRLQAAFAALIPKEKEVLGLAEEISHIASRRGIFSLTLKEAEAEQPSQSRRRGEAAPVPSEEETIEGASSFLLQISMQAGYEDLAYFLEEISRLPRLLRMESLEATRDAPLIRGEMLLRAFYLSGNKGRS
ncbi:MAG: hypothetical protein HYZ72_06805 [Deltaproteobacteria bacterium]|nr:hypothetical protein [Deltaproteobacteria bacterium]